MLAHRRAGAGNDAEDAKGAKDDRHLGQRSRARRTVGHDLLVGGGASALTLLVLVVRNLSLLRASINVDGDFAANAVLIDKALQWRLLVGNYSRVGFNHPGPFLLYVQGWSQWLFHDVLGVVPSAYAGQLLGIMILNALLLGVVVALFHVHVRSVAAAVAGAAALLVFALGQPALLASTWMPDVYFAPFLLFTVALGSFLAGRWATLPWLTLAACVLVHGHASFIGFVGPAALVVLIAAGVRARQGLRSLVREQQQVLVLTAGIVAVFAAPILLHVARHFPGEFGKYLKYLRSGQGGSHAISAVVDYALQYWGPAGGRGRDAALLVTLAVVCLALLDDRVGARRFTVALAATCGLLSLLFLNYGARGIDDLSQRYIGQFYLAVPAVMIAAVAVQVAAQAERRLGHLTEMGAPLVAAVVTVVGVVAVSAAATSPRVVNPYRGDIRLPAMHAAIASTPERAARPVALDYPSEGWPLAVGLMQYGAHRGVRYCAVDGIWGFLVSNRFICTPGEVSAGFHVTLTPTVKGPPPSGPQLFADPQHVVTASDG